MSNAAIYVRVSSSMQVDEGRSLESQEQLARKWCAENGHNIVRVYRDEAKSASTPNRPEFQRMMTDAAAKIFSVIVFYHTWRFSRSIETSAVMRDLESRGIQLHSLTDHSDTKTAAGKFQRNISLAVGEYQLEQLREATKSGKRERIRQGLTNGRPPMGYRREYRAVNAEYKQIDSVDVIDEQTAPIIRAMFELCATGRYNDVEIAHELNRQGHTTSSIWGKRPFGKDTVRAILNNPFYAGWVTYRGIGDRKSADGKRYLHNSKTSATHAPGIHPPLITQDLFDQCQRIRQARGRHASGRKHAPSRFYTLSGLVRCASCKRPMRSNKSGNNYISYRCTARVTGHQCNAKHTTIAQSKIMPMIDALIQQLEIPAEIISAAEAIVNNYSSANDYEAQLRQLNDKKRRINRMYQDGNIDDDDYVEAQNRIKDEMSKLQKPEQVNIAFAAELLRDFAALWRHADELDRRAILLSLIDYIELDTDARCVKCIAPKSNFAALFSAAKTHLTEMTGFNIVICVP